MRFACYNVCAAVAMLLLLLFVFVLVSCWSRSKASSLARLSPCERYTAPLRLFDTGIVGVINLLIVFVNASSGFCSTGFDPKKNYQNNFYRMVDVYNLLHCPEVY